MGSGKYGLPPLTLLNDLPATAGRVFDENPEETVKIIQDVLNEFGVAALVTRFETGPATTSYEITPGFGVRVERISGLGRSLARALQVRGLRIQAPIPGKSTCGIEVPSAERTYVYLREAVESSAFHNPDIALPLVLGKDVRGQIEVGDLAAMPHLLIAGAGGMGKTVFINSLLLGLLLARTPEQVNLILIDLKKIEFCLYEFIDHLALPIADEPKTAVSSLHWAVEEMNRRYELFKTAKVRDIKSYNALDVKEGEASGEATLSRLPHIVIIVDEFAELMSAARKEVEPCIVRLAQLSRVAGIHMVLASQRPSGNVFTDSIKVNIPARIAFRTAEGNDSRAIINAIGAEEQPDKGAMFYLPQGQNKPVLLQGAWTSDEEIRRVTSWICSHQPEQKGLAASGITGT
jgi:S-DNA-T family DNA segregation ATPase FtsK/SpoIIIE